MKHKGEETRKITVNLPASLIDPLLASSNMGITEMLRDLLKKERHRRACQKLRSLRGKVQFSLTYDEIKEDRE